MQPEHLLDLCSGDSARAVGFNCNRLQHDTRNTACLRGENVPDVIRNVDGNIHYRSLLEYSTAGNVCLFRPTPDWRIAWAPSVVACGKWRGLSGCGAGSCWSAVGGSACCGPARTLSSKPLLTGVAATLLVQRLAKLAGAEESGRIGIRESAQFPAERPKCAVEHL